MAHYANPCMHSVQAVIGYFTFATFEARSGHCSQASPTVAAAACGGGTAAARRRDAKVQIASQVIHGGAETTVLRLSGGHDPATGIAGSPLHRGLAATLAPPPPGMPLPWLTF